MISLVYAAIGESLDGEADMSTLVYQATTGSLTGRSLSDYPTNLPDARIISTTSVRGAPMPWTPSLHLRRIMTFTDGKPQLLQNYIAPSPIAGSIITDAGLYLMSQRGTITTPVGNAFGRPVGSISASGSTAVIDVSSAGTSIAALETSGLSARADCRGVLSMILSSGKYNLRGYGVIARCDVGKPLASKTVSTAVVPANDMTAMVVGQNPSQFYVVGAPTTCAAQKMPISTCGVVIETPFAPCDIIVDHTTLLILVEGSITVCPVMDGVVSSEGLDSSMALYGGAGLAAGNQPEYSLPIDNTIAAFAAVGGLVGGGVAASTITSVA